MGGKSVLLLWMVKVCQYICVVKMFYNMQVTNQKGENFQGGQKKLGGTFQGGKKVTAEFLNDLDAQSDFNKNIVTKKGGQVEPFLSSVCYRWPQISPFILFCKCPFGQNGHLKHVNYLVICRQNLSLQTN